MVEGYQNENLNLKFFLCCHINMKFWECEKVVFFGSIIVPEVLLCCHINLKFCCVVTL
jgi:hypothetical protein